MRKIPIVMFMLLVLSAVVAVVPAARAASVDLSCAGTETVTYQPGLLLTSQSVQTAVTGILAPCTSSDPSITAGSYEEDFTTTLSCTTLLAGRSGTRVFHWSNGETSTFAFNRAINDVGGQTTVTFTGAITGGEFDGATVIEQVVFVTPGLLQCLTPPGLTTLGPGPALLTIATL